MIELGNPTLFPILNTKHNVFAGKESNIVLTTQISSSLLALLIDLLISCTALGQAALSSIRSIYIQI